MELAPLESSVEQSGLGSGDTAVGGPSALLSGAHVLSGRENTPTSELIAEQGKGCTAVSRPEAGKPASGCAAPTGRALATQRGLARAGVGAPRELGRAQQARCNSGLKAAWLSAGAHGAGRLKSELPSGCQGEVPRGPRRGTDPCFGGGGAVGTTNSRGSCHPPPCPGAPVICLVPVGSRRPVV